MCEGMLARCAASRHSNSWQMLTDSRMFTQTAFMFHKERLHTFSFTLNNYMTSTGPKSAKHKPVQKNGDKKCIGKYRINTYGVTLEPFFLMTLPFSLVFSTTNYTIIMYTRKKKGLPLLQSASRVIITV